MLVTEMTMAGLVWLLIGNLRYAEASGEREVAGFIAGLAFCVIVVGALELVWIIGRVIQYADPMSCPPFVAEARPLGDLPPRDTWALAHDPTPVKRDDG